MNFVYKYNYYNGTGTGQKLKAISTATERLQDCHHRACMAKNRAPEDTEKTLTRQQPLDSLLANKEHIELCLVSGTTENTSHSNGSLGRLTSASGRNTKELY